MKHFTVTAYILENKKTLLIYHKKLEKWLPPGGHLEENETPPEGARREVHEETGLEVEFIKQENIWLDYWNAKSFERPYLCLLENIPAHGSQPAHQHIDLIYLARPIGGMLREDFQKQGLLRWWTLEEVRQLKKDVEIFGETLKTLEHLLGPK